MVASIFTELILMMTLCCFWCQCQSMRAALVSEPGKPEQITIGETSVPVLKDKHVLLKVYYSAINRADTLQRQGKYPPPPGESNILGLEAAGTVEKLGPGATKWKIGDRVMALVGGGGNAEFVAVHESHLLPVHALLSLREAAAIPEVWLTAFQLLHFVAHIKAGESVLIHAGGSGVGTAAVQLAKLAGAEAFVTAGTQEKINLAKSLGASEGFNYKEGPFVEKLLNVTNGRRVDVILDCVGGSMWEQNIDAIAMEGRLILFGTLGGTSLNGDVIRSIMGKRLSVIGSTLRARSCEYKSRLITSFQEMALPHFLTGTLKVVIASVLPFEELAKAHQIMESNANAGKIVIEVIPEQRGKNIKTDL